MNEYSEGGFPLAYLITIRTYGTWLYGDERGSVDRHAFNVYGMPRVIQSRNLERSMKDKMKEKRFCSTSCKERSFWKQSKRSVIFAAMSF